MPPKLTLDQMKRIAERRHGKCLSDTYINADTKLLWECSKGHRWEALPHSIKSGHWCPYCARIVKLTIEEMQQIAKHRGGKCLSKIYKNTKTKLQWECSEGHQWKATPTSIKNSGTWCPICSIRPR